MYMLLSVRAVLAPTPRWRQALCRRELSKGKLVTKHDANGRAYRIREGAGQLEYQRVPIYFWHGRGSLYDC